MQTNGETDKNYDRHRQSDKIIEILENRQMKIWTDKQTIKHTDNQRNNNRNKQTNKQTLKQINVS